MIKFDNLKAGFTGFILGVITILIVVYVKPSVESFVHNTRMKFDEEYAVEYQVREMAKDYGWKYVEDKLED